MSPLSKETGPSGQPAEAAPAPQNPALDAFSHLRWTTGTDSPVIAFRQDTNLHYTWISQPFLGRSVKQIVGRRDRDLIGWMPQAEQVETLKRRVLVTGQCLRTDISLYVDGMLQDYELAVAPCRDETGKIRGLTGSFYDITAYSGPNRPSSPTWSRPPVPRIPDTPSNPEPATLSEGGGHPRLKGSSDAG